MRRLLFFVIAAAMSLNMWAQTTISGKVTGQDNGEALEGVAVVVEGTTVGMFTDANGEYSLRVPEGSEVLVFTYVGRVKQEVEINGRTRINVDMASADLALDEVVVTAVGISRDRKALGYDVATIENEEITKSRETNFVNALAGKVAGVRVTQQSGTPGGGAKILIRGASSLGGSSQPLFVVDGMPISNSGYNGSRSDIISGGVDAGNRATDVNPDDIETISVLKGAAATALYGARARDGAIIITTKRGKKGAANISFNSSMRFDNVLRLPEYQNEYSSGDDGEYNISDFTNGWGPRISGVQDRNFADFKGDSSRLQAFPDNVRDFYETGVTFINSVSLADATDDGDFRIGYTNLDQTGTIPNSGYRRHNVSVNTGRKFGNRITGRLTANYVRSTSYGRQSQGSNNPNLLGIAFLPRTTDVNALRENVVDEFGQVVSLTPTSNNPFWTIENNVFQNELDRIFGSAEVRYDVASWLDISARLGTDVFREYRFRPTRKGTIGAANGLFTSSQIYNRNINLDVFAKVNKELTQELKLDMVLGYNMFENYDRIEGWLSSNLAVDELYTFANASSNANTAGFITENRLIGAFGDLTLSYKDWLFLTVTGRNDWNSTLRNPGVPAEDDDISYFYPSVGLSWVFTDALNLNQNIFSYGKLRANYAEVGSSVAPYSLEFTYFPITDVFTQYQANNNTLPHGGATGFEATDVIPEANLRPQLQRGVEFGLEMNFFQSRISLDASYYNQLTEDQILNIAVPQSTGFAAKTINAGSVRNSGIEIALGGYPVKSATKDGFNWNIMFNFQRNVQVVEELTEGLDELVLTSGFSGVQIKAEPGQPFGLYGGGWDRDSASGEVIINAETGLRQAGDTKRLGNIYPDFTLGINNQFTFKGFLLSFLVDWRQGGVISTNTVSGLRSGGLAIETLEGRGQTFIDQGVNIDADGNAVPNITPVSSVRNFWSNYYQNGVAEGRTFDASFVKLREVRFGYTFPRSWFVNAPISELTVALEGRNLWIIDSNVPHIDPETNFFGTSLTGEGVEFQSVPSVRSIGGNITLRF